MPGRWSAVQVLALAPDASSAQAAGRLAGPRAWSAAGASGELIWGLCAGSGQQPYQTIVDLGGPAYKCSCPSRKFPCKHALALLLNWADGLVPDVAEPADYAAVWKAGRDTRTATVAAKPQGERDEKAAAKRVEQRSARVAAGLAELEIWLHDQVRAGLSGAAGKYGHAEPVAARMVDAQAPGIAGALRQLGTIPASGDGWPGRLLGAYARLHLLARAHAQLDTLPPDLAATVRTHVGYPSTRDDILAGPAVIDNWLVLGVRDIPDGSVPARRTWLRGLDQGRDALVLVFDPRGQFGGNPDAAFVPGMVVAADLHFYPGRAPLRAAVGKRAGDAIPTAAPAPSSLADVFAAWSDALERDPWLGEWPVVLRGVPVPGDAGWVLHDPTAGAVPLLSGGDDPWVLAAVSGGAPVVVAGEWTARGLRPLTVWHGSTAVRV